MLHESSFPAYHVAPIVNAPSPQNLSKEQVDAVQNLCCSINAGHSIVALSGPAGSGKTSLIKELKNTLSGEVVISAMTNKAVDVLHRKGIPEVVTVYRASTTSVYREPAAALKAYLRLDDPFGSIKEEELMTEFEVSNLRKAWAISQTCGTTRGAEAILGVEDFYKKYFIGFEPRIPEEGVLIVDEASMLGGKLLTTVRKCFSKIILVGDEFQLPPVDDTAVFWSSEVIESRVTLSEVHRQSGSSEILNLAELIKTGQDVAPGPSTAIDLDLVASGVPVIVWTNECRIALTKRIRAALGHESTNPAKGEHLVCRVTHMVGGVDFVKNSMWRVVDSDGAYCILEDAFGTRTPKPVKVALDEYDQKDGLEFRLGYAITCHTAQGSEWPTVMIHANQANQCLRNGSAGRKWFYTAVTRAKDKLIWVSDTLKSF